MKRDTHALALGGIMTALCWVLLISAGILPFMCYAMSAVAGLTLLVVVFENGAKWAYLAYVAVSLLSFIMATDIEAVAMFITLFGYYPILRLRLQLMRPRWLAAVLKTLLFAFVVWVNYFFTVTVFGLYYLDERITSMPLLVVAAALLIVLVIFWVYDSAVGNITRFYLLVVRPRLKAPARP